MTLGNGQHDLLAATDLSPDQILGILDRAESIRTQLRAGRQEPLLGGRAAALVFQKPSLRTRVTFDLGVRQLGGHAIYLSPSEVSMGVRESVHDVAKNLERWVDVIVARVFGHGIVTELARESRVPVINALSDTEHPCQALADFLALRDHGRLKPGLILTYVGDGNNICHSLLGIGSGLEGVHVRVASPRGYEPQVDIVTRCQERASRMGGSVSVFNDPREAVRGVGAVYTDVWASMGQEEEAAKRATDFTGFEVTRDLMALAAPDALFMHDLPAHRGEEVAADVIDGPQSIVFDEAENRLHAQKAVLAFCLGL